MSKASRYEITFRTLKKYCTNYYALGPVAHCMAIVLDPMRCTERNCPVLKRLKEVDGE